LDGRIVRRLPDILGADKADWLGRDVLVIGDGHSAATAVAWLGRLRAENAGTRARWVVPSDRSRPCLEAADDPLPGRRATVKEANDLAERPPEGWLVHRKSGLLALSAAPDGMIDAVVGRGENRRTVRVQLILSLTGYKPDTSILEELQVRLSPVTGGAAGLAASLMDIKDCLSPVAVPPENLESGENGFYLVGHKSYGRLNAFLLRSGLEQLDMIFKRLAGGAASSSGRASGASPAARTLAP
jgi:hypothetical protein